MKYEAMLGENSTGGLIIEVENKTSEIGTIDKDIDAINAIFAEHEEREERESLCGCDGHIKSRFGFCKRCGKDMRGEA